MISESPFHTIPIIQRTQKGKVWERMTERERGRLECSQDSQSDKASVGILLHFLSLVNAVCACSFNHKLYAPFHMYTCSPDLLSELQRIPYTQLLMQCFHLDVSKELQTQLVQN